MPIAAPYDGAERRRHPRVQAALLIGIEAARSQDPLSSMGWVGLTGFTKDLSRGGVSLRLDGRVDVGTECVVRFFVPSDQIYPQTTRGKVLRAVESNSSSDVAVQFSQPLEILKLWSPYT